MPVPENSFHFDVSVFEHTILSNKLSLFSD